MNKIIASVLVFFGLFLSTPVFAQMSTYPTPIITTSPSPTTPTNTTTTTVIAKTYLPTSLHEGSKGAEVADLQTKLTTMGYYKGVADGIFGPLTRQAVVQFQLDHALTADGVAGLATRNVLATKITALGSPNLGTPTAGATTTTTPAVTVPPSQCLSVESGDDASLSVTAGDMQKTLAHFVVKNTCTYAFTVDRLMFHVFSSYMRSHVNNIKIYAGSDKVNPHYFAALVQPSLQNGTLGQYFSIDTTGSEAIAANTEFHILVKSDIQDLTPATLSGKNALVLGFQDFRITGNGQTYSYGGSMIWGPRIVVTY